MELPVPEKEKTFLKKHLQLQKKYDIIFCVAEKAKQYTEKYSSGRRGVTRNFVVTLEPPTLNPLIYKGFPQFK